MPTRSCLRLLHSGVGWLAVREGRSLADLPAGGGFTARSRIGEDGDGDGRWGGRFPAGPLPDLS